jgi:hypothetical protein
VTKSWKEHLHWDGLLAMAKEGPAPAELLASILAEFSGKSRDLKLQPFIQLHAALEEYAAASQLPVDEKLKAEFTKRVEEMAKQLETYAKDPAAGDAALAIGDTLGWLATHRQAPQLVAKVRQTYGQPNFFGYASQKLAAAGIEDTIDRVTGVSDNILGTDVHGSARMTGPRSLKDADRNNAMASNGSLSRLAGGYREFLSHGVESCNI